MLLSETWPLAYMKLLHAVYSLLYDSMLSCSTQQASWNRWKRMCIAKVWYVLSAGSVCRMKILVPAPALLPLHPRHISSSSNSRRLIPPKNETAKAAWARPPNSCPPVQKGEEHTEGPFLLGLLTSWQMITTNWLNPHSVTVTDVYKWIVQSEN